MSKSKIVFFLSGSIAAFKACQVISRLVQDGCEVQTVVTPAALQFIGPATLEGLTGKPVLSSLWQEGRAMEHIHLSRWADFGVLCPASANTVARLAHGLADDLVSAMILAWPKEKSLHLFPAMNHAMLANPATQENLRQLSARGLKVHPTQSGNLACGEEGAGRLLEAEDILRRLERKALGSVLLTAGATREPIDGIRFISNVSTGQTGAALAGFLQNKGWEVTYLHGQAAALPAVICRRQAYSSFHDLHQALREQLRQNHFTAVLHCAAVSDYSIASVNDHAADQDMKLATEDELQLKLKRNVKLLPLLKEYSANKNIKVVGFKLTLNAPETQTLAQAKALLGPSVDAVVANDWSAVEKDRRLHPGRMVSKNGDLFFADLQELADGINDLIFFPGVDHGSLS